MKVNVILAKCKDNSVECVAILATNVEIEKYISHNDDKYVYLWLERDIEVAMANICPDIITELDIYLAYNHNCEYHILGITPKGALKMHYFYGKALDESFVVTVQTLTINTVQKVELPIICPNCYNKVDIITKSEHDNYICEFISCSKCNTHGVSLYNNKQEQNRGKIHWLLDKSELTRL